MQGHGRHPHVVHSGDADAHGGGHRLLQTSTLDLDGRRRHDVGDARHRSVHEHPRGPAVCIAHDLSPLWIGERRWLGRLLLLLAMRCIISRRRGGSWRQPGSLHGSRTRHTGMSIDAPEPHGAARGGALEGVAVGKALVLPVVLIPAATQEPAIGLSRRRLGDACEHLVPRACARQIDAVERLAEPREMRVGIDQAGQNDGAVEIDDHGVGVDQRIDPDDVADPEHLAASDGDGFGGGLAGDPTHDDAASQDEISALHVHPPPHVRLDVGAVETRRARGPHHHEGHQEEAVEHDAHGRHGGDDSRGRGRQVLHRRPERGLTRASLAARSSFQPRSSARRPSQCPRHLSNRTSRRGTRREFPVPARPPCRRCRRRP